MNPLKIESFFEPNDTHVEIHFGVEVQQIFAQTAKAAVWLRGKKDVRKLIKKVGNGWGPNFKIGSKILNRLASSPDQKERLTLREAQCSVHTASLTALYFVDRQKSRQAIAQTLILLAGVTPVVISRIPLPPAVEVFGPSVSLDIQRTYEILRTWPHPGAPHGPLFQLHQLAVTLAQVPDRNIQIDQLTVELVQATSSFNFCIQCLAEAEVLSVENSDEQGEKK